MQVFFEDALYLIKYYFDLTPLIMNALKITEAIKQ